MLNVIFKGNQPTRATEGSAGHDLQSVESVTLYPGEMKMVRTGLVTAMPEGTFALLAIRSGCAKRGLMLCNGIGIVDEDYRGEWMMMIKNIGPDPYKVSAGDRIGQAIFMQYLTPNFIEGNPTDTVRGTGGFGSSGI